MTGPDVLGRYHVYATVNSAFQALAGSRARVVERFGLPGSSAGFHVYANQTHPYFGARHIYIALPTRFVAARGSTPSVGRTGPTTPR